MVARAQHGPRLVGAFGAAVTLGIAVALALGSVLADVGTSWRRGFAISALVGVSALAFLPAELADATRRGPRPAVTVAGPADYVRDRLVELGAEAVSRLIVVPGSLDADPVDVEESNRRSARDVLPDLTR